MSNGLPKPRDIKAPLFYYAHRFREGPVGVAYLSFTLSGASAGKTKVVGGDSEPWVGMKVPCPGDGPHSQVWSQGWSGRRLGSAWQLRGPQILDRVV